MKFFQTIAMLIAYFLGIAFSISYIVRIGGPRTPPILPGQVWKLPGIGDVIIVRSDDDYVYYEDLEDRDHTWCCRPRMFREHATIVLGRVRPAPIFHMIDPENNNVIHLKKDKKDDSV